MIPPNILLFLVFVIILDCISETVACTKRHHFAFHLKDFEGQNVKERSEVDVLVRAHIVGTESQIIYDNFDNLNTLRPNAKVEFDHIFQPNEANLTLAIQFLEENGFTGGNIDHAKESWTSRIFKDAMKGLNYIHGTVKSQECIYQKNHTIGTMNTNCTDMKDNSGGPVFAVDECNGRVFSFDYTFCVVVEREDCSTTMNTTTSTTASSTAPPSTDMHTEVQTVSSTNKIETDAKLGTLTSPANNTVGPYAKCKADGSTCINNSECCNESSCGGFADNRGNFRNCGTNVSVEVKKPELLIATDQAYYSLPYPLTNEAIEKMVQDCKKGTTELKCGQQRSKRQQPSRNASHHQPLSEVVQGVEVVLEIPRPQMPSCDASLSTQCSRDDQCCFRQSGYGACTDNWCTESGCKKSSESCAAPSDCCSNVCQYQWTEAGQTKKRCGLIPSSVDASCENDMGCISHQCCADNTCLGRICLKTIKRIDNAFNQMLKADVEDEDLDDEEEEDWKEEDDLRYHVISITTICVCVIVEIGQCWFLGEMKKIMAARQAAAVH